MPTIGVATAKEQAKGCGFAEGRWREVFGVSRLRTEASDRESTRRALPRVRWQWRGINAVTMDEALTALLQEFDLLDCLDQWDDVIREQCREDGYTGLKEDHPRVQRYREICRVLRDAKR